MGTLLLRKMDPRTPGVGSPPRDGSTEDTWNHIISPKTRANWISPRSNERLKNAVAAYKEKTDKCHALAVELRERGLFAEAVRVLQVRTVPVTAAAFSTQSSNLNRHGGLSSAASLGVG